VIAGSRKIDQEDIRGFLHQLDWINESEGRKSIGLPSFVNQDLFKTLEHV